MNLPWRQTWNQRNFVLNKPSTCYLLTQSPQQSWVGSNAYYHFATRKLRLREVKWLTPCHTELRFHTQDSARCSGALMPRGHQPQGRCRGELASPQRGPLTLVLLESLHHLLQGLYLPSLQQGGGRGCCGVTLTIALNPESEDLPIIQLLPRSQSESCPEGQDLSYQGSSSNP